MFSDKFRTLGLLIFTTAVSACGIFADDKVLPAGERKSVLVRENHVADAVNIIPASSIPTATAAENWMQTGGTSYHVMQNIAVSHDMRQIWSATFGDGASKRNLLLAQPVIFEGTVFAQDVHGTVFAFDLRDGRRLWKQKLKPVLKNEEGNGLNGSGLAVDRQAVYAATGFGSVFALSRKDGSELWRFDINTPLRTAPVICGDKLYIQGLDNSLTALHTADGRQMWKHNISAEDTVLAGGASPACMAEKNLLVAGFSNGELQAFNADIGYPLWSVLLVDNSQINLSTDINAVKAPPVVDNKTIYAVGHNNLTAAIDYRTGEIKWQQKIGGTVMPWLAGKYLFIVGNDHELSAVATDSGKKLWSTHLLNDYAVDERSDIYVHGPVMLNGQLFVAASNGVVYVISPEDGRIVKTQNIGKDLPFAPIAAAQTVVFATNDAELIAFQ